MQTPFHAYLQARELEYEISENDFAPVFASSDIKVYPFQMAAANFALRSPYQKGVVLCDEAGMGKSHEAMLVIAQKRLEGKTRILLAIPNADLCVQWTNLIEKHYTLPFVTITNNQEWTANRSFQNANAFDQDALVIATYDILTEHRKDAESVAWDLTVWEEASALSSVYLDANKQAKALKRIAENSFKILLTGTPIEKNIMDLYGLIYFIDESVLPDEQTFLKRYLRRPENYPELAISVSKFCFRTLRSQAEDYALIPKRIHATMEYNPSASEKKAYDLLFAYVNKEKKIAFPEMSPYDLALKLLGLLGSSTAAIISTLDGVISRLKGAKNADEEICELENIKAAALKVTADEKGKQLVKALGKIFPILKKCGANKKVVVFTESVETQKYLYTLLKDKYKVALYNGSADYTAIEKFKTESEILISTDNGARGFNLEEASLVVNYDLLYNTLKMEQRIDRCHRLNQKNDVLVLSFIDKNNFADVRKLELVNKRLLVSDGVFGVSDAVVGGFSDDLDAAIEKFESVARTREHIERDYLRTLASNAEKNKQTVSSAEDILFTTFTKQLANSVKIVPDYIEEKAQKVNDKLWALVKYYFDEYNKNHTDCHYIIDDEAQTITATNYTNLPCLFYYWNNSGSRRYYSQKQYGMAKDFKPSYGRITLTGIIGQGIIRELECAESGTITLRSAVRDCKIALYSIAVLPQNKDIPYLIGKTVSDAMISQDECRNIISLPVESFTESGRRSAHWLKTQIRPDELYELVDTHDILKREAEKLTAAQAEEVERLQSAAKRKKSGLTETLSELQSEIKTTELDAQAATGDRMKQLSANRILSGLRQEMKRKQEGLFFEEMQIDVEVEKQIDEFISRNKPSARVVRQFILDVKGAKADESN